MFIFCRIYKLLLNKSRWLEILFLLGLYVQQRGHFFLRKFSSINNDSMDLFKESTRDGISSRTKTIMPPPNWLQSKRQGKAYPGIINWPLGKDSSNFVSDMTIISTFPLIWSASKSDLFLIELICKWPRMVRFKFLLRTSLILLTETLFTDLEGSLDLHSSYLIPQFTLSSFQ